MFYVFLHDILYIPSDFLSLEKDLMKFQAEFSTLQ